MKKLKLIDYHQQKKTSILLSRQFTQTKKKKNINQSLFVENKISVCTMNMCSGIK